MDESNIKYPAILNDDRKILREIGSACAIIYIYICVCVCVCVCAGLIHQENQFPFSHVIGLMFSYIRAGDSFPVRNFSLLQTCLFETSSLMRDASYSYK